VVLLYPFVTSALEGCGWSAPRPGRFTPRKDPVPIVQEAGWAPGPVWTCAKNLVPTGIRSPDRPARNQSLYRLSYPLIISIVLNIITHNDMEYLRLKIPSLFHMPLWHAASLSTEIYLFDSVSLVSGCHRNNKNCFIKLSDYIRCSLVLNYTASYLIRE
jgi:hypothetical protein